MDKSIFIDANPPQSEIKKAHTHSHRMSTRAVASLHLSAFTGTCGDTLIRAFVYLSRYSSSVISKALKSVIKHSPNILSDLSSARCNQ